MEETITNLVIGVADKYTVVSTVCMIIGAVYISLTALRGVITAFASMTKTEKDDKIVNTIFAFCDKFSYGFGKLSSYFESKAKEKKSKK